MPPSLRLPLLTDPAGPRRAPVLPRALSGLRFGGCHERVGKLHLRCSGGLSSCRTRFSERPPSAFRSWSLDYPRPGGAPPHPCPPAFPALAPPSTLLLRQPPDLRQVCRARGPCLVLLPLPACTGVLVVEHRRHLKDTPLVNENVLHPHRNPSSNKSHQHFCIAGTDTCVHTQKYYVCGSETRTRRGTFCRAGELPWPPVSQERASSSVGWFVAAALASALPRAGRPLDASGRSPPSGLLPDRRPELSGSGWERSSGWGSRGLTQRGSRAQPLMPARAACSAGCLRAEGTAWSWAPRRPWARLVLSVWWRQLSRLCCAWI